LRGNFRENVNLEDKKEMDEMMSHRVVVRIRDRWKWLIVVSNGWFVISGFEKSNLLP
jgi:hypothetical protein